jgi:RNA polymerase sigma-70 factor (ECF subfamily)
MTASRDEVRLLHAGDAELFRRLVERYSPRLLAIARSFTDDLDEAHDLVQDVWVRVFEKRQTFAGRGSLLAWICTIGYSVCAGRPNRPVRAVHSAAARAAAREAMTTVPVSGTAGPDVSAERSDLRGALHRSMGRLTERERSAVLMRLVEGRSTRETAEALGCAEGTVKATLHHALRKLQRQLKGWEP